MFKIVLKRKAGPAEVAGRRPCGHREKRDGCVVHSCCACYLERLRKAWYPGEGELREEVIKNNTGEILMKKALKTGKQKRVSAADVLLAQFGLQNVKSDDELIKLVKEATGSKKFDAKQLAWYKSRYRAGKLKGQNSKAGHLIKQGSLLKKKASAGGKKATVKTAKTAKKVKVRKESEEPIEE